MYSLVPTALQNAYCKLMYFCIYFNPLRIIINVLQQPLNVNITVMEKLCTFQLKWNKWCGTKWYRVLGCFVPLCIMVEIPIFSQSMVIFHLLGRQFTVIIIVIWWNYKLVKLCICIARLLFSSEQFSHIFFCKHLKLKHIKV